MQDVTETGLQPAGSHGHDQPGRTQVTAGTKSWERGAVDAEREFLTEFLEDVAATETIRTANSVAIDRMALQPGSAVLDAGCGTGLIFEALAGAVGASGSIVGLDHGAGFLREARSRADASGYGTIVALVHADAHRLPFADGSFDAAHTERVLMHLRDPDAALRELMRVVRPGGWVVCVEPDLRGMRVDHPDAYRVGKIMSGFCASLAYPAMGLELNRRMFRAGFETRTIDVLTEVSHDYDDAVADYFTTAAQVATDNGWIFRADAERTLLELRQAADEGIFTSYASMFVVAGQVPR